jgi:predicted nucleic acid-binding protein
MPIVDSSVALKWIVDEPDRPSAIALLKGSTLAAPDFIQIEIRSALWNRVQRRLTTRDAAHRAAGEFATIAVTLFPTVAFAEPALSLALELSHPIYDCLYLAAAIQHDQPLVTADQRFLAALANTKYADRAVALTQFPLD